MIVLYHQSVEDCLFDLVEILYNEEYFGFYESAMNYVLDLKNEIESSIDTSLKKKAPLYFDKYAKDLFYISCKRNIHTTWYVFFKSDNVAHYVYYIGNNHNCAQYL